MRKSYTMSLWDRLYLPTILKGLTLTFKHLLGRKFTLQYPEEVLTPSPRFRGIHKLTRDEQGREKCVACYMCATACPAHCITIEAEPAPWEDREKYPSKFEIDMLRCIFCGYCIEACPEEAIVMTNKRPPIGLNRQEMIFDKERLLNN